MQSWNDCVLIGYKRPRDAVAMATLAQKIETETRMRDLLEQAGLPQPDYVEYGFTCIRLLFYEPKLCLVIDIDDPPDTEDLETSDRGNPRAQRSRRRPP